MKKTQARLVNRNRRIHDRIASRYNRNHREIFNEVEQGRIARFLADTDSYLEKTPSEIRALDFGAGTGNLTRHMASLGWTVTAADVSQKSLDIVQSEVGCDTLLLQEVTLKGLPDASFDAIATYSVLHHIPDYVEAVCELARLCAPFGILIIDHEPSPLYWERKSEFGLLYRRIKKTNFQKYFSLTKYIGKVRRVFDPKFTKVGDIHVWPDDHVERNVLDETLATLGFEKIREDDFFLHRADYRKPLLVDEGLYDTRCCSYKKVK